MAWVAQHCSCGLDRKSKSANCCAGRWRRNAFPSDLALPSLGQHLGRPQLEHCVSASRGHAVRPAQGRRARERCAPADGRKAWCGHVGVRGRIRQAMAPLLPASSPQRAHRQRAAPNQLAILRRLCVQRRQPHVCWRPSSPRRHSVRWRPAAWVCAKLGLQRHSGARAGCRPRLL